MFSWHEMGIHDLPASLQYVANTTQKPGEIIYIGHSMGTTMFFVFSSTLPEVAKNVQIMVALAPVAYMTHLRSPIRYLSPFVYDFQVCKSGNPHKITLLRINLYIILVVGKIFGYKPVSSQQQSTEIFSIRL